jgi:hypothetical protein
MGTAPQDGQEIAVLARDGFWIVTWANGWRIKALPGRDPICYLSDPLGWTLLPTERV